jgi:hypothetical protein
MISILGANSVSGDYEVSNSLRFNDGDTAKLARTPSGAGNRKTWTWSGWVKRSTLGAIQGLFVVDTGSAESALGFLANDTLRFYQTGQTNGLVTNAVFRDPAAWYHIVLISDTTQSTESSRTKLYINGEQVTSFSAAEYLSQNADTEFNTTNPHEIGFYSNQTGGAGHFDGYMAEVNFIDGTAKAHTDFGETNDNNVWVPKKYSGSYGTNGFFLQFKQTGTSANSSGIGADTSGNDNHFTPTNLAALDVTEDTCTNNFCTLNPLDNYWANATFSEGNCKMVAPGTGYGYPKSTIGVSSGKWYFEAKASDLNGNLFVGIASTTGTGTEQELGYSANDYGYKFASTNAGSIRTAGSENAYGNSISTSDILGVAFDLDNNKLYFSKNGTYQNSGDPAAGSNGFSITAASSTVSGFYSPSASDINSNNSSTVEFNFGNPSFSISSGNNDGKYGNFEYAPPSGYYALCTKRLAEFG